MFDRVLVANRGEIAARIVRTLHELGVAAVAVYAEDDQRQPHVRLADAAVPLGAGPATGTYLDGDALVEAAVAQGCQAVHPGYGFLSEDAGFARAVEAAGLSWVGPPPRAMELLGDKARALALARELGVPVTEGSDGPVADLDGAREVAESLGYPVLLKAVAGGGGMGIRPVGSADELSSAWAEASAQAEANFGRAELLVEKLHARPRHLEVQVAFDDQGRGVHLFERECSLQRRHQKLVEEAPAAFLTADQREALVQDALALCEAAGVSNLATVEFLWTDDGHVFNEVNPRLQVEHTVTEEVTGQDLVAWQLRLASGEALPCSQDEIALEGHAVQARVNVEDVLSGFAPAPGRVANVHVPSGPGVRVDHALVPGAPVATGYDSLLAKVIGHGEDRAQALDRCRGALAELRIGRVPTTAGLLHHVLGTASVREGKLHTNLLEGELAPAYRRRLQGAMASLVMACPVGDDGEVVLDGHRASWTRGAGGSVTVDGQAAPATGRVLRAGRLDLDGRVLEGRVRPGTALAKAAEVTGTTVVKSPMPGVVDEVLVAPGDRVAAGAALVVVEAMKMKNRVPSPADGVVDEVLVSPGSQVGQGAGLVTLAPAEMGS